MRAAWSAWSADWKSWSGSWRPLPRPLAMRSWRRHLEIFGWSNRIESDRIGLDGFWRYHANCSEISSHSGWFLDPKSVIAPGSQSFWAKASLWCVSHSDPMGCEPEVNKISKRFKLIQGFIHRKLQNEVTLHWKLRFCAAEEAERGSISPQAWHYFRSLALLVARWEKKGSAQRNYQSVLAF